MLPFIGLCIIAAIGIGIDIYTGYKYGFRLGWPYFIWVGVILFIGALVFCSE